MLLFHTIFISSLYLCRLPPPTSLGPYITRRISLPLLSLGPIDYYKNSKRPSPIPGGTSASIPVAADVPCRYNYLDSTCVCSRNRRHHSDLMMIGSIPICLKCKPLSDHVNEQNISPSLSFNKCSRSNMEKIGERENSSMEDSTIISEGCPQHLKYSNKRRTRVDLMTEQNYVDTPSSSRSNSYSSSQIDETSLPTQFGKKSKPAHFRRCQTDRARSEYAAISKNFDCSKDLFDICLPSRKCNAVIKASWRVKDTESMKRREHSDKAIEQRVLRPGMVLLKHYITHSEQVSIVKRCQELGLGPGGFYQPGYKDGAKLRLQMMCLGLNWDPQTRKYEVRRSIDGIEPPVIPPEFGILVQRAIQDSHTLIKKELTINDVEGILPSMSPNICIVNFYTITGKLGLHQDRDESPKSLREGLPVVSFSVGDSAEFLYGDQRDIDMAEKVVLESGDVLIFGGESRHMYHGVSSIIPNSAPQLLLKDTMIRPGRLNLTFRQF